MTAYYIKYHVRNSQVKKETSVDAKDLKSAKVKLGKKNGYKDGRMIVVDSYSVIGYF